MATAADIDPHRFVVAHAAPRGFRQAYVRVNPGGVPLVCVHGWPETMRIYWRVIEPLAAAGFEVIVPDLRGFGASEVGPDGFHDVTSHAHDLHALVHDVLGHESVVLMGGDLGGPVVQDLALRHPRWVDRMVLFNSPLPYLKTEMAGLAGTRAAAVAADYFVRQGRDADGLASELGTPAQRRAYIATFYTSRFWAHPGSFAGAGEVDFHTEPFADGPHLRAGFGTYESAFDPSARSAPSMVGRNEHTPTLVLFGPSDHVIYPAFDQMAAHVFARHVGPFLLRDCG
ncbi:MAG TPA: alpha/beta hydrolase, partial [Ilumatobacteraceae bacterium]